MYHVVSQVAIYTTDNLLCVRWVKSSSLTPFCHQNPSHVTLAYFSSGCDYYTKSKYFEFKNLVGASTSVPFGAVTHKQDFTKILNSIGPLNISVINFCSLGR